MSRSAASQLMTSRKSQKEGRRHSLLEQKRPRRGRQGSQHTLQTLYCYLSAQLVTVGSRRWTAIPAECPLDQLYLHYGFKPPDPEDNFKLIADLLNPGNSRSSDDHERV